MHGKRFSLGLGTILAVFTVALFVTTSLAATEKVLHRFGSGKDGASPYASRLGCRRQSLPHHLRRRRWPMLFARAGLAIPKELSVCLVTAPGMLSKYAGHPQPDLNLWFAL